MALVDAAIKFISDGGIIYCSRSGMIGASLYRLAFAFGAPPAALQRLGDVGRQEGAPGRFDAWHKTSLHACMFPGYAEGTFNPPAPRRRNIPLPFVV